MAKKLIAMDATLHDGKRHLLEISVDIRRISLKSLPLLTNARVFSRQLTLALA